MGGWGEDVSCARPQTSPRYGFYVNAVSVLLSFGGGIISLYKTYTSDRDLREAIEMWEEDRAEAAEMESRLAMIKKKEDYAAAVASAAASAAQGPVSIFKNKKTRTAEAATADGSSINNNNKANAATGAVESMLPISPSSEVSRVTTCSFTTVPGPEERHKRSVTIAALSAVDLESEEGTVVSAVPPASVLSQQSPEPQVGSRDFDVESGAGATGAAAAADAATPDNASKGAVEDDSPPPQGWEVRTTPSGDK